MKSIIPLVSLIAFSFSATATVVVAQDKSDLGEITFTVKGGKKPGKYGGKLSKDSSINVSPAGGKNYVRIMISHEPDDKSTVSFSAVLILDSDFKPGKYDLKGSMSQAAVLPQGTSRGTDQFFSVVAMLGSGTLEVESVDMDKGSIKASFTITQGETVVTGTFEKKAKQ